MFTYIIPVIIFVVMMFLLILLNVKDSIGNVNNALLAYYIGISIFTTIILVTLMTPFVISVKIGYPPKEFYRYTFQFVLALGAIYVMRRQDWWDRIINGIRSWKSGHPNTNEAKILIEHAIQHPKDREWVTDMLWSLKSKGDVRLDAEEGIEEIPRDIQEGTEAFPILSTKDK